MTRVTRIKQKLDVLKPQYLEIVDETPKHAGHIENSNLLETHLIMKIYAEELNGMTLIKQHKAINKLLSEEFETGLHALSIKVFKNI